MKNNKQTNLKKNLNNFPLKIDNLTGLLIKNFFERIKGRSGRVLCLSKFPPFMYSDKLLSRKLNFCIRKKFVCNDTWELSIYCGLLRRIQRSQLVYARSRRISDKISISAVTYEERLKKIFPKNY